MVTPPHSWLRGYGHLDITGTSFVTIVITIVTLSYHGNPPPPQLAKRLWPSRYNGDKLCYHSNHHSHLELPPQLAKRLWPSRYNQNKLCNHSNHHSHLELPPQLAERLWPSRYNRDKLCNHSNHHSHLELPPQLAKRLWPSRYNRDKIDDEIELHNKLRYYIVNEILSLQTNKGMVLVSLHYQKVYPGFTVTKYF